MSVFVTLALDLDLVLLQIVFHPEKNVHQTRHHAIQGVLVKMVSVPVAPVI